MSATTKEREMETKRFYMAIEKGNDWNLIGLGESYEQAIEEPLDNGYEKKDIEVQAIT